MSEEREWAGNSRAAKVAALNLGIVYGGKHYAGTPRYRAQHLEDLDAYYENRQYEGLPVWDSSFYADGEYIPVRKRCPRIKYALAKVFCQRVASKLVGDEAFPALKIEDDPDTEQFIRVLLRATNLKSRLLEPIRRTLNSGSGFVRFYFVNGEPKVEGYLSKYCYPEFDATGELASIRIRYVYEDPVERDEKGQPVQKWYQIELGTLVDVLYNNPPYSANAEPEFEVVARAEHGLGFVQGEWFRTCEEKHSPDGYSLIEDILDFIDELNYSLSQSSQAISYNQDPQLTVKGMDADELEKLIKSSQKAWNMGRDGEAKFVESTLGGVEVASEFRDKTTLAAQHIARVVLLDPEKFASNAQSGKAMEMLHGPLVELVNELRPIIAKSITALVTKMAVTTLVLTAQGQETAVNMPEGWKPQSLDMVAHWAPVFPMTMTDLKEKVGVAVAASSASLISRESMTRWLAKDFDIEDIEAEIAKVNSQEPLNPFGSF